jgi:single-stranded-DNA-specific exonuclease
VSTTIRRRETPVPAPANEPGLAGLLSRLYRSRGAAASEDFAYPLSALLPPQDLAGMEQAIELLWQALQRQSAILVVGDFDVDGATSTALALQALRAFGFQRLDFLVPNRFKTGYGLTPGIVTMAAERGTELIITVDNGISSIDGVAAANAEGIEVLVTDHHLPGAMLPAAAAIVNPNQPGCSFKSKALAGVGVVFYLMTALRRRLRDHNWFATRGLSEPNMANYLDLVALGTVADVVPLDYNNRILVHYGLRRIRAGKSSPGIMALLSIAGRNPSQLVAADLGFAVAPRLNAAGRLDDMTHGIQCLLAHSIEEAQSLALELDGLNSERREIEKAMQREALAHIDSVELSPTALPVGLCLYDPGWHQGVVGILAARIREKYHRPVIAFADAGDGIIKGSARSVPGLHIRDALDKLAAGHPGLLDKFGGHAMAAGMELRQADFERFSQAFDRVVRAELGDGELRGEILSDGELPPALLGLDLAQTLRGAGPWGQHFPEPVFDGEFIIQQQKLVGGLHLKLVLAPLEQPGRSLDAIWFNVDTQRWPNPSIRRAHIAYRIDANEFRGLVSLQLMVSHLEVH